MRRQAVDGPEFNPRGLLEELAQHGVDFVVIGGVAGTAYGSAYNTFDVDIVYARDDENLDRMTAALRSLGATLRGAPANVPFQLDARTLASGANFAFNTRLGPLDILGDAAGAPPYERLRAASVELDVAGVPVRVASIDHLIAMKEAAGRTKDKLMAMEYRRLAEKRRQSTS